MVDAGNGEHGNEGGAVNGTTDNPEIIVVQSCPDDTAQQNHDAQSAAHNVGNHIH